MPFFTSNKEKVMCHAMSVISVILLFSLAFPEEVALRTPNEEVERNGESLQALDLWTQSRAYPNTDIPADRYFRAYIDAQNIRSESEGLSAVPAGWVSLGPTN